MKDHSSNVENLATNFEKMNDKFIFFCKDQLAKFKTEDKATINFKKCRVAICLNGGRFITIYKKRIFRHNTWHKNKWPNYCNASKLKKKYLILIYWEYWEKWVVVQNFNDKEQLYTICNDESIIKIDILKQKPIPKAVVWVWWLASPWTRATITANWLARWLGPVCWCWPPDRTWFACFLCWTRELPSSASKTC